MAGTIPEASHVISLFLTQLCGCFTDEKMKTERSSDNLPSKFQASLSNCLPDTSSWMSNLNMSKTKLLWFLPTTCSTSRIPLFSVMAPSFQLLRPLESSFSLPFPSPLTFGLSQNPVGSKYMQNLTTSHHLHCYHSGLTSHHGSLGLLKQASNQSSYFWPYLQLIYFQ